MRRIVTQPRHDWREIAQELGFDFHTIDGAPYWDESAYYAFSLRQIEDDVEAASAEIVDICRELIGRCVNSQRTLEKLRIPRHAWNAIAKSWSRGDPSLYGRMDFAYDGESPPKLLEFNADTPTALFEAAVFQWRWLEDLRANGVLPSSADQYNSIHEKLVDHWRTIGVRGGVVHFACMSSSAEDSGTIAYLAECANQAGLRTRLIDIGNIGLRHGVFVDLNNQPIRQLFKLYPWEWMFDDQFGRAPAIEEAGFIEPAWKSVLSNKGALALMWEIAPNHPNLLPTFFEEHGAQVGERYARKPLKSREGANVTLHDEHGDIETRGGTYGAEGFIRQALIDLPCFDGNYPIIGSWIVDDVPCGMGVREDRSRITGDSSRFVPHAIL